jgi:hypothetical protein
VNRLSSFYVDCRYLLFCLQLFPCLSMSHASCRITFTVLINQRIFFLIRPPIKVVFAFDFSNILCVNMARIRILVVALIGLFYRCFESVWFTFYGSG